jgi:ferrous iron transport protein B
VRGRRHRLRLNLRLVLEARQLGLPVLVALNMSDVAERQGVRVDRERLSAELGLPVVPTVGVAPGRCRGADRGAGCLSPAADRPPSARGRHRRPASRR